MLSSSPLAWSCTRILRIIPEASIRGTIPPFQHEMRGRCYDSTPVFLPARADRLGVGIPDALRAVAVGARCRSTDTTQASHATPQALMRPQPFLGPTRKPPCDACEEGAAPRREPPCAPPPLMVSTRGRRRQVDTSQQCCPAPDCRYGGWLGLGNLRANGHPSGGPWRQLHCTDCDGYFLETQGTLFHGKRVSVDLIVHVIGCLAEGLGIRGTARVFEVDPNTGLHC